MSQLSMTEKKKFRLRNPYYYPTADSIIDNLNLFCVGCIIRLCDKNIIRDLEKLGYQTDVEVDYSKHKEIITYKSGYYFPQEHVSIAEEEKHMWVDCGTNRLLFWLLTGLSNETDYRRVFIRKARWKYCKDKWGVSMHDKREQYFKVGWKEAKPEEILVSFGDETTSKPEELSQDKEWIETIKKYLPNYGTQILFK